MPKKDLADRFAAQPNRKRSRRKQPLAPPPAAAAERPATPPARPASPAARPPSVAPATPTRSRKPALTFDYRYVAGDLKKIVITAAVMILIMVVLSFVIR